MPSIITTIVAITVIALVLFFAIRYIYKEKKKGSKCIGCPYADSCSGKYNEVHSYPTKF